MINNLDKIKELLSFPDEDTFYHAQIIKRKKEHLELGSNSMIVKTYYIKSIEHLDKIMPEMIAICDFHNARGCINLNRRSFEKMAFQTLRKVADQILNKDYKSVRKAYESVCGAHPNESNKKWIIDLDVKDLQRVEIIRNTLFNCMPERRKNKVLGLLETKSGYHIITSTFNMQEAGSFITEDIHKDNPTILYIPCT